MNLHFSPELLLKAQTIRVLLLDVDGVLTDGGIYIAEQGETFKRFSTLDGHGIKLLQASGVKVAVISGRDSAALRVRLQALGVQHMELGTEDKLPAAQRVLHELGLDWSQVAVMGDDWPDLPLMKRAAFVAVPQTAHAEALALAHWVVHAPAGGGAVRAVCDCLLVASGAYRLELEKALGN